MRLLPHLESVKLIHHHSGCGSQADTAIIRDSEISSGKATPLGRTQGNGPVDAAAMIGAFMGTGNAPPANNGAASSVGVEDNIPASVQGQRGQRGQQRRQLLGGLFGGGKSTGGGAGGILGGILGGGGANAQGVETSGPPESRVAAMAGAGESSGLPTCGDDGTVTMTLRQVRAFLTEP